MNFSKFSTNIIIALLLFSACVPKKEHEEVKARLDSLTIAKEKEEALLLEIDTKMDSIGILLDSIEVQEEGIMLNLESGIKYDDYVGRIAQIQEYMDRKSVFQ